MSHLKITNLQKKFGIHHVLKNIDLEVESGEFVVFVGPSGSGKSTLLRCISGLEPISEGLLEIAGQDTKAIPLEDRGVAMVFQSYALYPHMNVFDNIAFSLQIRKMPKDVIEAKVFAVAQKLQLTDYLDRQPSVLSGGQRQRVAIGRAIVRDPHIFLFDEPLSNLDASLRVQMRMEIAQLKEQLPDTTMIYVTHDQVEAMTLADRIVVLREGRVEAIGTPLELYENPKNVFVAGFIGSPKMNFFSGDLAVGFSAHTVGVRPESMKFVTDTEQGWAGSIAYVENLGSDTFAYINVGIDELMIVRLSGKTHPKPGMHVRIGPDGDDYHLFDEAGVAVNNTVVRQY